MLELLGWIGTGLTMLAFTLAPIERTKNWFFPLNMIAAFILTIYAFTITENSLTLLYMFIFGSSLIKTCQLYKQLNN